MFDLPHRGVRGNIAPAGFKLPRGNSGDPRFYVPYTQPVECLGWERNDGGRSRSCIASRLPEGMGWSPDRDLADNGQIGWLTRQSGIECAGGLEAQPPEDPREGLDLSRRAFNPAR